MSRPAVRRLGAALSLLLALCAGLLALGAAAPWAPALDAFSAARAHLGLGCLLAGAGLAALRRPRRAGLALAVAGLAAWGLGPAWRAPAPHSAAAGPAIALAAANLWAFNRARGLEADLLALDADVLALQEVPAHMLSRMPRLRAAYPHRLTHPPGAAAGRRALLSRFPLRPGGMRAGHRPGHASAVVETPFGPLRVMTVHFSRPYAKGRAPQQAAFGRFALDFADFPAAVLGDFNAGPWSPLVDRVAAVTGTRPVGGLRGSWRWAPPESLPAILRDLPFGLPLDHVLLSAELIALGAEARRVAGSDHMAVTVRIAPRASD